MITIEYKNRLRNHANRNIFYLLDKLAVKYTDRGDGLIQSCCPATQHGGDGDNETAFSWRQDIGKWICFSHHCEEDRGNDIFGIVSSVLGSNFIKTIKWIEARLNELEVDLDSVAPEPKFAERSTELFIHTPQKEDNLEWLKPDYTYLIDRGYDTSVLERYQVGLWQKFGTYMHDRMVFPVRDHEGHLVCYTGRTVRPKEYFDEKSITYRKWVHGTSYNVYPRRGELFTSSILFNLCNARWKLKESKSLILVEGPLDGMKLEQAGIHNWVATLGTSFCPPHRTLLVQHGITDLYVAYDDDPPKGPKQKKAGDEGWKRLQRIVGDLFNIHRVVLPPEKDCGDLTVEQLQELFQGIGC